MAKNKNIKCASEVVLGLQREFEQYEITTIAEVEHREIIVSALNWLYIRIKDISQENNPSLVKNDQGILDITEVSTILEIFKYWKNSSIAGLHKDDTMVALETCNSMLHDYFIKRNWEPFKHIWIRSVALTALKISKGWNEDCNSWLQSLIEDASIRDISINEQNCHHYARLLRLLDITKMNTDLLTLSSRYSEFIVVIKDVTRFSPYLIQELLVGCYSIPLEQRGALEAKIREMTSFLEEFLKSAIVDSWIFVPYCSAIVALGKVESETSRMLISNVYFKIFREGGRRADGSFYSDVIKTCWALLALQQTREIRRISMPSQILKSNFRESISIIQKKEKDLILRTLEGASLMFLIVALLVIWLNVDLKQGLPSNLLAWMLGGSVALAFSRVFIIFKNLINVGKKP